MKHTFVTQMPDHLADNTLYVSIEFSLALHKCFCGCGNEVVTPFSPAEWQMTYDGETVSLHPSIGNWSFPCKSHYWIRKGKVEWSETWPVERIEAVRKKDADAKRQYFAKKSMPPSTQESDKARSGERPKGKHGLRFWKFPR